MWLGRLELIPILVLFTRSYWKPRCGPSERRDRPVRSCAGPVK
jgi:Trk-type K+ transport system membrane component